MVKKAHKDYSFFLESIFRTSNDAIEVLSMDGAVLFWNKASEKLYGYSADEIIGMSILMLSSGDRLDEIPLLLFKIKNNEYIEPYLTIRKGKDGNLVEVLVGISPMKDAHGKIVGASLISRKPVAGQERIKHYVRALIEASLDPLVTMDSAGHIVDANKATIKITGISKKKLEGTAFSSYFVDTEKAKTAADEAIKKGIVTDFPLTIRASDGTLTDVLYSSSSYKDTYGKVVAVFATIRDILTTKQAMYYSRSIIEASLDPLVIINPLGKITDVNEAMVKVTGLERESLIDSDFFEYFTDREKARESYRLVFSEGNLKDYPLTIRHKTGKLTDVLYNASVYKDIDGNVLGVAATARDITQQIESYHYARSLIEIALDPLLTIDIEGNIIDVNDATVRLIGKGKEALVGQSYFSFFTEPDKAKEGFKTVLSDGSIANFPLAIRDKNNTIIDVLFDASVYKDEKGNILKVCVTMRDFTQQKQISQYARSLIEASLDPLLTINTDGKITDVNEATIQVTGIGREELIGSDFLTYFTEPEEALLGYQQVFAEGFVRDYPLSIRHVSGKITDVLYNASVYRDTAGNVLGVFVAARDITQRKKAEALAHETSAYTSSLIESSLDPLITLNSEGKITSVNHATTLITGVTREWLIGSDFTIYFTEPKRARQGYRLILKEGLVRDFPLSILHTSGKIIDVLFNATVFKDAHGKVQGVFAAARDITETKKTSQYARTLIEASLDPFVMMNPEGMITDVNEATVKVTGLTREHLIGTNFSKYFTEPEKATAGYEQVFLKGFITDYPLILRHVNGTLTDVLYNASIYKDTDGNVLGIFATARDYSTAKKVTRELEVVNKELDAFTYSVAHDLKSPLRAIDGFSKILMADFGEKLDEEGHRILNTIVQNTVKMGNLIEDLLLLSHLGKSEIKKEFINMHQLVDSISNELTSTISNRDINIQIKPLDDCKVDRHLISQVWINLIANAIKFTQTKKKAVIEIGSIKNKDNTITYYIKDNGLGFDIRYVDKLFGVFQRLHGQEIEGTGIGLANAKRIITRHNGTISGTGKIGEGATFSFTLPKE